MRFHQEGKDHLIVSLMLLGLVLLTNMLDFHAAVRLGMLSVTFFFILFSIVFFRNPDRQIAAIHESIIYAPADGKVVVIEEVEESHYIKGRAVQISIFMSPLNVHVNRIPVSGDVEYVKYEPGKYLVAWHPKSSTENERNSVGLKTTNGHKIMLTQIAGALARRIVCYAKKGDQLTQGQDFGFIKLGSRVDVFLPIDSEVLVRLDQSVFGNKTKLARLI